MYIYIYIYIYTYMLQKWSRSLSLARFPFLVTSSCDHIYIYDICFNNYQVRLKAFIANRCWHSCRFSLVIWSQSRKHCSGILLFFCCAPAFDNRSISPLHICSILQLIYIYIYIYVYIGGQLWRRLREREREREMYTYKRVSVRVWDCQFFEQFNYSRIVWLCLQLFTCV